MEDYDEECEKFDHFMKRREGVQRRRVLKPGIVGDMMADFKRSDEAVEWLSGYSKDNHAEDRFFKGCGFTLNEVMELEMNLFGRFSRG